MLRWVRLALTVNNTVIERINTWLRASVKQVQFAHELMTQYQAFNMLTDSVCRMCACSRSPPPSFAFVSQSVLMNWFMQWNQAGAHSCTDRRSDGVCSPNWSVYFVSEQAKREQINNNIEIGANRDAAERVNIHTFLSFSRSPARSLKHPFSSIINIY